MDKQKGIAYCGLACVLCSENRECAGCRNEGCTDKDWCKNFACCKTKNLDGCRECHDFPCNGSMLDRTRIRAFAGFIRKFGTDVLMECLERNERNGTESRITIRAY